MDFVWQFCNEYAVPKDKLENFKDVTAQDIVCSQVFHQTLHVWVFFAKC